MLGTTIKYLGTAAMLTLSTWAQQESYGVGTTQQKIYQVLDKWDLKNDSSTISLEEAEFKVKMGEKIREQLKKYKSDDETQKMIKFYGGEEEIVSRFEEMIDEIASHLDDYWAFDSNWIFSLVGDNGDFINEQKINQLYERTFFEYILHKKEKDDTLGLICWGIVLAIISALAIAWSSKESYYRGYNNGRYSKGLTEHRGREFLEDDD